MSDIQLDINYTEAQHEVFFELPKDYNRIIIPKGGRVGLTRGGVQAYIEYMLGGTGPLLWGDTTHGNVRKYFNEYFMPILKQLGPEGGLWEMNWGGSVLRVRDQLCHFRASQNPHNWEGFGYKVIFLNEAGIILQNPYLWNQAVRKMLLDYSDSILIAAGVPKGDNMFKTLNERALSDDPKWGKWVGKTYTTYDNPFVPVEEIDAFVAEEDEGLVNQEIYGQFVDETDVEWQAFNAKLIDESVARWKARKANGFNPREHVPEAGAIDPSRGGDECPFGFLYEDLFMDEIVAHTGNAVSTGPKVGELFRKELNERLVDVDSEEDAGSLYDRCKKEMPVRVDYINVGTSVVDDLEIQFDPLKGEKAKDFQNVVYMQSAGKSNWKDKKKRFTMKNKRAAWTWNLRELYQAGKICTPPDPKLRKQLLAIRYFLLEGNKIGIEKKPLIKKRLGGDSPDRADMMIYLFSDEKKTGSFSWR